MVTNFLVSFTDIMLVISVLINTIVWSLWFKNKFRARSLYALGPFLFSIHALIFFIFSAFNLVSYEMYFIWRNIVSINALLLLICYGILMPKNIEGGMK